jgi:hypothetical protein
MHRTLLVDLIRRDLAKEADSVPFLATHTDDEVIDAARVLWGGEHVGPRGRWLPNIGKREWRGLVSAADSYNELRDLVGAFVSRRSFEHAKRLSVSNEQE